MRKYRNLKITYDNLIIEVDYLKRETITLTKKYNDARNLLSIESERLSKTQNDIQEYVHTSKSKVRKDHKDYVDKLDKKQDFLDSKEYDLGLLGAKIAANEHNITKSEIELQKREQELNIREVKVKNSLKLNIARSDELEVSEKNMKIDRSKFDIKMKLKEKEYINLENNIESSNLDYLKVEEDRKMELEHIKQQKKVLQNWEQELKERELRYKSDMRTLISAKKHIDV